MNIQEEDHSYISNFANKFGGNQVTNQPTAAAATTAATTTKKKAQQQKLYKRIDDNRNQREIKSRISSL